MAAGRSLSRHVVAVSTISRQYLAQIRQIPACLAGEIRGQARSFESIARGPNYQVKRLLVLPGKRLSLQLHQRRAEHWVVISGIATVARDDESLTLRENESVYIPRETKHRLGNDGEVPLEVIEVQTGEYLGDDDIFRFEDDFGRDTSEK